MKASSNHSEKPGVDEGKSKIPCEAPDHIPDRHRGQPAYKKQVLPILSPSLLRGDRLMKCFTPLKLQIEEIFNTFKDQPWVMSWRPLQHNPSLLGLEDYCSYHESKR